MLAETKSQDMYIDYFTKINKKFKDICVDKIEPLSNLEGKTNGDANGLVFPMYGCAKFTLEGKPYCLKPGLILHAGPDMNICKEVIGENQCCCFILHFEVQNKEKVKYDLENEHFMLDFGVNANIINKINKLFQSEMSIEENNALESKKIFNDLFADIISGLESKEKDSRNKISPKNIEMLNLAIHYINSNYNLNLSVSEVAEMFGMSSRKFGHLFKQYTGVSPIVYIRELKMEKAKYLLRFHDSTITEIAESLGYKDYFYFSRVFKEIVGVSPSQFRDELKEKD